MLMVCLAGETSPVTMFGPFSEIVTLTLLFVVVVQLLLADKYMGE